MVENNNEWYRGLVKAIFHGIICRLCLIDYGHVIEVSILKVKLLNEHHASREPFVMGYNLMATNNDNIDESDMKRLIKKFARIKNVLVYAKESYVIVITEDVDEIEPLHETFGVLSRKNITFKNKVHRKWFNEIFCSNANNEQPQNATRVTISRIISPSEIYIKTLTRPGVTQKCHLNQSNEWSLTSKELLPELVKEYQQFAITYGEISDNTLSDTFGITLCYNIM